MFLCVHINSASASAHGTETLWSKSRNSVTEKNGLTKDLFAARTIASVRFFSAIPFPEAPESEPPCPASITILIFSLLSVVSVPLSSVVGAVVLEDWVDEESYF